MHLGCGIAVGMTGLAAGYCIGVVGDTGVRAYMEQSRIFVGMVLILIFGEVLGLYGYEFYMLVCGIALTAGQTHRCPDPQHQEQGLNTARGRSHRYRPTSTIKLCCRVSPCTRRTQHCHQAAEQCHNSCIGHGVTEHVHLTRGVYRRGGDETESSLNAKVVIPFCMMPPIAQGVVPAQAVHAALAEITNRIGAHYPRCP